MNLHLNNYKGPTIGVSFWVGSTLPKVESQCINNNANYFDEFYLICNQRFSTVSDKVTQLIDPSILIKLQDLGGEDLKKLLPFPFKANYGSDMMTYFTKKALELFGLECEKVMYLDTDYIVYNQFMIREIFDHYNNQFLLLKENNFYTRYKQDSYINACWSYDSGNDDNRRSKDLTDFLRTVGNEHYACMGPHFTNREEILRLANILNANPHTFDPRLITVGWNTVKMNPNSLGCHLALTLPREIGYHCQDIYIDKPLIKLNFTYDN